MTCHKPGTIGLVSTGGLAGRLIRLAQEGHWNHVVVAKGDGQVYSAEPGGVRLRPETSWSDIAWLVKDPWLGSQGSKRAEVADGYLGWGYNWPAIVAFARWWFPLPKWFTRWAASRRKVICSELAVLAIRGAGGSFLPGRDASSISPAGIDVQYRRNEW